MLVDEGEVSTKEGADAGVTITARTKHETVTVGR